MNKSKKKLAISERNLLWKDNNEIPKWVNKNKVDLDQFYTRKDIAKKYFDSLLDYLKKDGVKLDNCLFIEPSAGDGSFFDLLPEDRRIGLDIMPMKKGIKKKDFLSWKPKKTTKKLVFVGNPPFGYRAWLALVFMNHAAKFADYVGFILPMAFQSDGKGSPKHRVTGLKLVHTDFLPKDSFYSLEGNNIKINALWQIWKKGINIVPKKEKCDNWLEIFTVDLRKERLCGIDKMDSADFFIQRTYYNEQPNLVKSFSKVKYVCGYGLIIKKDKKKIIKLLNDADWNKYSNLAAHNCRHISMYHINRLLTDNNFIND